MKWFLLGILTFFTTKNEKLNMITVFVYFIMWHFCDLFIFDDAKSQEYSLDKEVQNIQFFNWILKAKQSHHKDVWRTVKLVLPWKDKKFKVVKLVPARKYFAELFLIGNSCAIHKLASYWKSWTVPTRLLLQVTGVQTRSQKVEQGQLREITR